ncbi:MAG TPA: flagellar biosynthetic protein FliO, partial [Pirellulales bacterium]|nr:flagellar biosynthetic protein FliO [Pirellulales bacterium]
MSSITETPVTDMHRSLIAVLSLVVSANFCALRASAQDIRPAGFDAPLGGTLDGKTLPRNPAPQARRMPLARPKSESSRDERDSTNKSPSRVASVPSSAVTILGSLGIALGLFFIGAWFVRRSVPSSAQSVPTEVVELLGRVPLMNRQQAQLIRVGNKMVLVAISPAGAHTITEVTDPAEVDRMAEACRTARGPASGDTFRR